MLWTAPDSWDIINSTIGKITCEEVDVEVERNAEELLSGGLWEGQWGAAGAVLFISEGGAVEWMASEKGSEGRQVSSCLFLKEMPLAVYQSRV